LTIRHVSNILRTTEGIRFKLSELLLLLLLLLQFN